MNYKKNKTNTEQMMLQTIDGKIQNLINKGISLEKKNRFDDAFDVYVGATKLGSTIAYCKMGWLYRRGCLSTGRDIGAAHDCFEKAANSSEKVMDDVFL